MTKREEAMKLYDQILKSVVMKIGDDTTYDRQLNGYGKAKLGVKFRGVFPSDAIPKLNDLSRYAILNLDRSSEPGSHWVALAKENNHSYFYDSFGRKATKIIPNLVYSGNGRIINTDLKAEQKVSENDCGARSLAWLILFDKYGSKIAKLI